MIEGFVGWRIHRGRDCCLVIQRARVAGLREVVHGAMVSLPLVWVEVLHLQDESKRLSEDSLLYLHRTY